jgi:hypothetical protein
MQRDKESLKFELMGEAYYASKEAAEQDAEPAYPKWEEPLSAAEQAKIEAEEAALAAELDADAFMLEAA